MRPTGPTSTALPTTPKPQVGTDIYVGSSWYLSHGVDDFHGGLCEIVSVEVGISAGKPEWFVGIKERPGHFYNYAVLLESQEEWKKEFGDTRGYPDPDDHPDSNRWD